MSDATPAGLVRLRDALAQGPVHRLAHYPSPVEEMGRLRRALDAAPRLLVKRDDALSFAFGGNKVRKLERVVARALEHGADTLVTVGGVQSNHARCTAAVAARLGLKCHLVLNGPRPEPAAGNALLCSLFGAETEYVATREDRAPAMEEAVARLQRQGQRPFAIPLGSSTGYGAVGLAAALAELMEQGPAPDVIVLASSSGGTQAGLMAGCALAGLSIRIVGVSADDRASVIGERVRTLAAAALTELGAGGREIGGPVEVDDAFVGDGYGVPTRESREAQELLARTEALVLDPTYTAKAAAALIAWLRAGRFPPDATVLFWHTGGVPGLFT